MLCLYAFAGTAADLGDELGFGGLGGGALGRGGVRGLFEPAHRLGLAELAHVVAVALALGERRGDGSHEARETTHTYAHASTHTQTHAREDVNMWAKARSGTRIYSKMAAVALAL